MLSLGLDTGGTYTDAVIVDDNDTVLASAKALTTHARLIDGIREALARVIGACGDESPVRDIAMVSLSSTLATNAIVEGKGARAGLVMIGTDPGMVSRGGLREALVDDPWLRLDGGHDAAGQEKHALDTTSLASWIDEHAGGLGAFAVCAEFGTTNPAHELTVRDPIRRHSGVPVSCAHELSARLNAPRRALTALLNARLLPRVTQLMDAVEAALVELAICARLMVVKGDGSLIDVSVARERPVETILSGPAASVVGTAHLAGHEDMMVADIGGTTTDIAILSGGQPRLDPLGASVGGFRTMVNAAAVHSVGLGGDSAISLTDRGSLRVGPRRILPVCRLAAEHAAVLPALEALKDARTIEPNDLRFVWCSPQATHITPRLRRDELPLWSKLDDTPRRASTVAPERYGAVILERLVERGLVAVGGLTPTDAAHALGLHTVWSGEASRAVLNGWQRLRGLQPHAAGASVDALAEEVLNTLAARIALAILDAAYEAQPPSRVDPQCWLASQPLLMHALAPHGDSRPDVFTLSPRLSLPLVAVGASAATHFPRVRSMLGMELRVPPLAGVANALGAVVGAVLQRVERRITSPQPGLFRLHGETEQHDFEDLERAISAAEGQARALALDRAHRAGAEHCEVSVQVDRTVATLSGGESVFVEAGVSAIAKGRPARTQPPARHP